MNVEIKNQTAVEWLIQQLSKEWLLEDRELHLIEKAKEMEKEQIIKAHGNKKKTKSINNSIVTYTYTYTYTGEMYFNDNYY